MARTHTIETRRDRLALAEDAGVGRVSWISVFAGVMTAYGTFILVLALVAAVLRAAGIDVDYTADDWRQIGTGAGLVMAGVLFVAYLFGGYVTGRMARRAGVTNGVLVFVAGVLLAIAAGAVVTALTDNAAVLDDLRRLGIPTSASDWADAGLIVGVAALVAMLAGALVGAGLGERWHGKLLARALDPTVGAEAALRQRADDTQAAADRRHDAAEARVVRARGDADLLERDRDGGRTVDTDGDGDPDTVERRGRHRLFGRR